MRSQGQIKRNGAGAAGVDGRWHERVEGNGQRRADPQISGGVD